MKNEEKKKLEKEYMNLLKEVTNYNKTQCLGLFYGLDNTEQRKEMLEYIKANKDNKELMRITNLIDQTHIIRGWISN